MKFLFRTYLLAWMVWSGNHQGKSQNSTYFQPQLFDHHVHFLSPALIKLWKDMGVPFSRPDLYYYHIDSILQRNGAATINLISMAYVYSSQEFGNGQGEVTKLISAENDYLAELKKQYPRRIKAFYGIDPLHPGAMDEVRRCHEQLRLDGIKMHFNASQIYLTIPDHLHRVSDIFHFASQKKIPVLLHFDNSHRNFGIQDVHILADSVLAKCNFVDLQIAHFGTSGGYNSRTKRVLDTFISLFNNGHVIARKNIKFDISAVGLDKDSEGVNKLSAQEFTELAMYCRKIGFDKIVFGTDYPLYLAPEYLAILTDKLDLTKKEIKTMLRRK